MEITLVRHGEPEWEPEGRAVDDPRLSPRGHQQAQRVASALREERFDALYVSPLVRARETMAPIASQLEREPTVIDWLHELRMPKMEGMSSDEVRAYFQGARSRAMPDWWDGFPGGEDFASLCRRVGDGVHALLAEDHGLAPAHDGDYRLWRAPEREQRVLIVAHEGTNALLIASLLGIEPTPWEWMRFSSVWAGISHLRLVPAANGAVFVLDRFNHVGHLEEHEDHWRHDRE